jgi:hypothetical protein
MVRYGITAAILLPACVLAAASPAKARIVCRNDYQLVGGNLISTPYCADNYVAAVARQYGVRVSDAAIRNNPNKKREVCRFIGHDIRIAEHCNNEVPRGRRGF